MSVYLEDLQPGMSADYGKTITEADILLFSAVSGDNNPVHLNAEYAENTLFKTRIAHGMLTASFISTILGTRLPGEGTIFLSNSCKFKAPVRIGDTVTARCTVSVIDVEKSASPSRPSAGSRIPWCWKVKLLSCRHAGADDLTRRTPGIPGVLFSQHCYFFLPVSVGPFTDLSAGGTTGCMPKGPTGPDMSSGATAVRAV